MDKLIYNNDTLYDDPNNFNDLLIGELRIRMEELDIARNNRELPEDLRAKAKDDYLYWGCKRWELIMNKLELNIAYPEVREDD